LGLRALTRYFEAVTGSALTPGVVVAIKTFGDRINLHPHLYFLVTEGGVDGAGVFHKIPRIDDSRLAEIFGREVPAFLVGRELLSPNGRSGSSPGGTPASYGLYANAHRGYVKKTGLETSPLRIVENELKPAHSKGWAAMIRYFSWPFSRAGGSPDEIRRIGHHGRLPGRPSPPLKPSLTGSEVRFMLPCDGKMGQWEQRCSKDVPSASAAEKETLIPIPKDIMPPVGEAAFFSRRPFRPEGGDSD